jgi:FkbM family methyltransferase
MKLLTRVKNRVLDRLARRKYAPAIEVRRSLGLLKLGSAYGGWTLKPSGDLNCSTILSCGLGEDASFDVTFASRFNATVIIIDPTPRALAHFAELQKRIGQPALHRYVSGGKQPTSSYDLSRITNDTLILEPSALWVENTKLKFFAPPNPEHVSHSIINFQNNYSSSTAYIEVAAVTLETLLAKYGLTTIQLLKLDIEGAEIEVIRQMLEKSIRPRQVLVEFDEMNFPSERSKKNAEDTDRILKKAGYVCRYFDGLSNFLYVLH